MYLTPIRWLFLFCFVLLASGLASAQGNPFADETARMGALTKSGNEKMRNKDFDGALADFNEAILTAEPLPDNAKSSLYLNRSRAFEGKGDLDKALDDLNRAIKLQSNNFYAYQNRAHLHEKRKELKEALADYGKAIGINPKFFNAYL